MKQACLLAIALAGTTSAVYAQETFDYGFVQAIYQGYDTNDNDGAGIAGAFELGTHWFVFASYTRETGGYGSDRAYGTQDPDADFLDFESHYKRIGLGYHRPVAAGVDFVARALYDRRDSTFRRQFWHDAFNDPNTAGSRSYRYDSAFDALALEAGVRALVAPHWEVWGVAGYGYRSRLDASNIQVIDLTDYGCFPFSCQLLPENVRAWVESEGSERQPFARLGTLVRLTEHWGLTTEGRFGPGGSVAYNAGLRYAF